MDNLYVIRRKQRPHRTLSERPTTKLDEKKIMKLMQQIMREIEEKKQKSLAEELVLALEHETYKTIPGTNNSVRHDPANTSKMTQRHAHAYAKPNGKGKELYAVNFDGSGHDGSSGVQIPVKHAEYLRGLGYQIPANLVLESLNYADIDPDEYSFCVLEGDA